MKRVWSKTAAVLPSFSWKTAENSTHPWKQY